MQGATNPPGNGGPGGATDAPDQWFASLYAELRRMAERELRRAGAVGVSPTTLVHEAYLKFSGGAGAEFPDRARFLGYAARAMRRLVIDFARNRQALKRGAGLHITQLNTEAGEAVVDAGELGRLSDALDELARLDPRLAELVDLKFFCGFSLAEIAGHREVSERTVQRDWEKARLALFSDLTDESAD